MTKLTGPALLAIALLLAACGDDPQDGVAADTAEIVEDTVAEQVTDSTDDETDDAAADATGDETAAPASTDDAPAAAPAGLSMNGFRYCEILISVPGEDGAPVTEVWGTPGVDPCDDADWESLDPEALMVENNATSIYMNGPRYFTVDGTFDTAPGQRGVGTAAGGEAVVQDFGGVSMTLLATVDGVNAESQAYIPELVVRTTTWTFMAGTEVYELTAPDGEVYLMQSYALFEDPTLTAADLPTLGDRLDLPDGWSYQARVLDEDLQVALSPDGAVVVTDELGNAYQRNG